MNYTSFVNKFRIDEAMALLTDKRFHELSMEEVSDMVGFSNRQSFYASFFKINNMTPREYKMRHFAQNTVEPVKKAKKTKANKKQE